MPAQSFKTALLGSVYGTLFGLNLASHLPYLAISLASCQAFFDAFELDRRQNPLDHAMQPFGRLCLFTA